MTAVDHEGHGPDEALAGFRAAPACTIDAGHHLALKKVVERLLALGRRHAKCHAMARPATVQPEHQARCLRRPAVTVRVDAEAAVQAPEAGRAHLDVGKARMPHEGAVAEHPEALARRQSRAARVTLLLR